MLAGMVRHVTLWLGVLIFFTVLDQFVSIKTQLLVLIAVLTAGALLLAYGTIARNKWGINVHAVSCPRCGASIYQRSDSQDPEDNDCGVDGHARPAELALINGAANCRLIPEQRAYRKSELILYTFG